LAQGKALAQARSIRSKMEPVLLIPGDPLVYKSGFRYRQCLSPGGSFSLYRKKLSDESTQVEESDAETVGSVGGETSDDDTLSDGPLEVVIGSRGPAVARTSVPAPEPFGSSSHSSASEFQDGVSGNTTAGCDSNENASLREVRADLVALEKRTSQLEVAQSRSLEYGQSAVLRLQTWVEHLERNAETWPVVTVCEAANGNGAHDKHIRVECPGVDEDAVEVSGLPNGVCVRINGSAASRPNFERDFDYDHRVEGYFQLRMDRCTFEYGVLCLVLEHTLPQRMRLQRDVLASTRAALVAINEESGQVIHTPPRNSDSVFSGIGFDAKWHDVCMHRGPEVFLMTPCALSPGACSSASDLSDQLWLCPQNAHTRRADNSVTEQPTSPIRRATEIVEQPVAPMVRTSKTHHVREQAMADNDTQFDILPSR